jgi:hypothetical protein
VLGAAATVEWFDGFDAWTAATATVAWREPRWSVHATVRAANHVAHDDHLGFASADVTRRAGASTLLYAEVADLGWLRPSTCPDYHAPTSHRCQARDALQVVWLGAWWNTRAMRVGVSAALLVLEDLPPLPILPLLSFAWDHDL